MTSRALHAHNGAVTEVSPEVAHVLSFYDVSVLAAAEMKSKFSALERVERLIRIIRTGNPRESMAAERRLAEIRRENMEMAGMLVRERSLMRSTDGSAELAMSATRLRAVLSGVNHHAARSHPEEDPDAGGIRILPPVEGRGDEPAAGPPPSGGAAEEPPVGPGEGPAEDAAGDGGLHRRDG